MGALCGKSSKLSPDSMTALKQLFDKMDLDHDSTITKEEALKFWTGKFAKASADQMFGQSDEDTGGTISWEEYLKYWQHVRRAGYSNEEIVEEVTAMISGESWKDWGNVAIAPSKKSNKD